MKNTITLNNISHHFDTTSERIELFKDLSIEVHSGETMAIVGPSGAGKSSLLSIAAGLEKPAAGKVHFVIEGERVDALDMRANSGFIFQQFHLMPELDAIGNLALPLRLKGNRAAFDIAAEWLENVGLKDMTPQTTPAQRRRATTHCRCPRICDQTQVHFCG